jgi:hypothetical protein
MKTWLAILQRSPWKNKIKGEAWFDKTHWTLTHQLRELKDMTEAEKMLRIEAILWATFEKPILASEEMNSFKRYQCWGPSSMYINIDLYGSAWITGVFVLAKMRVGAYVFAERLIHARAPYTLPPEYCNKCPSCLEPVKETLGHIMWGCDRWRRKRAKMMKGILQSLGCITAYGFPENYFEDCPADDIATLLLGGTVPDSGLSLCPWWQGGVLDPEDQITVGRGTTNDTAATREWDEYPLFQHVARYLGDVHPKRSKLLAMRRITTTTSQSPTTDMAGFQEPRPGDG